MNEVTENILDYILGGKAEFTLLQEGSSEMKYKVMANVNRSCYFLYTENINDRNIKYQGYFLKKDMSFHKGKNVSEAGLNVKAINAFLWLLSHHKKMPSIVHVYHNGKCSRCGKKLTDAESLRTGLGPTCRRKAEI